MSTADNKMLVNLALQRLNAGDVEGMCELMHDEGSWTIPFRSDRFPFGGTLSKGGTGKILAQFRSAFRRFVISVGAVTAEENRVVVEATVEGDGPGGARYRNVLCLTFLIKDGRLYTIREFFDPFQAIAYNEQLEARHVMNTCPSGPRR